MSKNMVERVAEAMEEAAGSWAEGRLEIPEECPYPILARAAIEAMREPTEEMLSAAERFVVYDPDTEGLKENSDDLWRAMITAALKP